MKILLYAVIISSLLINACQTSEKTEHLLKLISESDYHTIIEENSYHKQLYSGFYNDMDLTGAILNSKVSNAQVDQLARLYQWDEAKYTQEKIKSDDKLKKETEFFVSFFTPEKKHDDLHKNKTLWKIFLDVDGKRFEGKVTKIKLVTEEIQGLYPFHNRFSTPYSIIFPISMKSIETSDKIRLTITGPVASVSLDYGKIK